MLTVHSPATRDTQSCTLHVQQARPASHHIREDRHSFAVLAEGDGRLVVFVACEHFSAGVDGFQPQVCQARKPHGLAAVAGRHVEREHIGLLFGGKFFAGPVKDDFRRIVETGQGDE